MPIALLLAGTTQGHLLQDGDVVFHHRGFADDDTGAVVEHDAAPQPRGRVDVDGQQPIAARLQMQGQQPLVVVPEGMAQALGLQRQEALGEQKDLQQAGIGRIPRQHRFQVSAGCRGQCRPLGMQGSEALGEGLGLPRILRQGLGAAPDQGSGQIHRLQQRARQPRGQGRGIAAPGLGLGAQELPEFGSGARRHGG